MGIVACF